MPAEQEKKLEGGWPIYTISLKKSWSKKPTYWIALFKVPAGSLYFYFVVRSWKWKQRGEAIEGSVIGERMTARQATLDRANSYLDHQTGEKDYVIEGIVSKANDLVPAEVAWLDKISKGHRSVILQDDTKKLLKVEESKDESSFETLQKKRRKGAFW